MLLLWPDTASLGRIKVDVVRCLGNGMRWVRRMAFCIVVRNEAGLVLSIWGGNITSSAMRRATLLCLVILKII